MLDTLFRPKSVAVIGASQKELNIGNRIIKNLIDFGFKGAIYPINAKVPDVRGVTAYKSILDVPTEVDVVHLPIPAVYVPQAMEECGQRGVGTVILNGGGFSEIGPVGAAIEDECIAIAKKYGMRIFGPNCQGIINTDHEARAYCNFTFTRPEAGAISIAALSGGVAELIHQTFAEMGVGTRLYASNGNACDISIPEIVKYYGDDEGTRVIVLYVEGLRDPQVFLDVAREVTKRKPILAMKAGRTEDGAKAAASHTGGIAKKDITTDLIFEKAGIISFNDEAELCQAAACFAAQPIPKGPRVGIITNTGGPAVIGTDVLVREGLVIPPLSDKTISALKGVLFAEVAIRNPLDVLATANATHFRAALDAMMDDDEIDSIYINFVTPFFVDNESVAREIGEVSKQQKKPIVCNLMTDKVQFAQIPAMLKEAGVPFYGFPGTAARALAALVRYGKMRARKFGGLGDFNGTGKPMVEAILKRTASAAQEALGAADGYGILGAYGIPVPQWRVASNSEDAKKLASEIGFPVVVKADSPSLLHKTDQGGVALNLHDEAAVGQAVNDMSARFGTSDLKFLIQKQAAAGRELIIGGKRDDEVGAMVMLGLGGIHVEVLKDVAFKLCPVTDGEVEEMMSSLKAHSILDGVRGEKGVNRKAIIEVVQRLSHLLVDFPHIREIDLNPVIAREDAVCAVDVRMVIER
jgi:acetate---CoA ligase (ADP-forming)